MHLRRPLCCLCCCKCLLLFLSLNLQLFSYAHFHSQTPECPVWKALIQEEKLVRCPNFFGGFELSMPCLAVSSTWVWILGRGVGGFPLVATASLGILHCLPFSFALFLPDLTSRCMGFLMLLLLCMDRMVLVVGCYCQLVSLEDLGIYEFISH